MLDLHHRYLRLCVLFFFAFLQSTTFSLQSGGLGPENLSFGWTGCILLVAAGADKGFVAQCCCSVLVRNGRRKWSWGPKNAIQNRNGRRKGVWPKLFLFGVVVGCFLLAPLRCLLALTFAALHSHFRMSFHTPRLPQCYHPPHHCPGFFLIIIIIISIVITIIITISPTSSHILLYSSTRSGVSCWKIFLRIAWVLDGACTTPCERIRGTTSDH